MKCPNCGNETEFYRMAERNGGGNNPVKVGKVKCLKCGFVTYDNADYRWGIK